MCIVISISVDVLAVDLDVYNDDQDFVHKDVGREDELQPLSASGCGDLQGWDDITHEMKKAVLRDVGATNYRPVVGNNPDIYYNSSGTIYLCGAKNSSFRGNTYKTVLDRSWYLK